jgi:hypothetical protein
LRDGGLQIISKTEWKVKLVKKTGRFWKIDKDNNNEQAFGRGP